MWRRDLDNSSYKNLIRLSNGYTEKDRMHLRMFSSRSWKNSRRLDYQSRTDTDSILKSMSTWSSSSSLPWILARNLLNLTITS
jgi:hypothetical protein